MASVGVDRMAASGFTEKKRITVRAMDKHKNRITVLAIAREASLVLPPPTARPIKMVEPIARPTIITVSMCIAWLPIETAVVLSTELNCPIMNKSAIPYKVCRK